jgi:hypothetical protein
LGAFQPSHPVRSCIDSRQLIPLSRGRSINSNFRLCDVNSNTRNGQVLLSNAPIYQFPPSDAPSWTPPQYLTVIEADTSRPIACHHQLRRPCLIRHQTTLPRLAVHDVLGNTVGRKQQALILSHHFFFSIAVQDLTPLQQHPELTDTTFLILLFA